MSPDTPIRLFRPACSEVIEQATLGVLRSWQIASGPCIDEFQTRFGELIKRQHVICTSDMTHALAMALHLSGVGVGDEVLTLAYSCMASTSAISLVSAKPRWVDIDPDTASMSVEDLKRSITPRCKAVTLYHVAGYPGPVAEIAEICRQHGLLLIEDCNNALGATVDEVSIGQTGSYAVYSFYPNRQIHAIDGGAVACPTDEAASRAAKLRRFGVDTRTFRDAFGEINPASDIPEVGWPAPFSNLNAAVGLSQLSLLDRQLTRTRDVASRLQLEISQLDGVKAVQALKGANPAYWVLLLMVERRDHLLTQLKHRGVECSKLHFRNDSYSGFGTPQRTLPGTTYMMDHVLGIPCGWWLCDHEVNEIAASLRETIVK